MEQAITLNVGGKHFMTYRSTLLKYPTTLLGMMYSSNNGFKVDEIQFFDRSSKIFEYILNFYRTGLLYKPTFINNSVWEEEINYWGLPEQEQTPDLSDLISEMIQMIKDGKLVGPEGPQGPPGMMGMMGRQGAPGPPGH